MKDIDAQLARATHTSARLSEGWWKNVEYYVGELPVRRRMHVEWSTGDDNDPRGSMGVSDRAAIPAYIDAYCKLGRNVGGCLQIVSSALARVSHTEKQIVQPTAFISVDVLPLGDEITLLPLVFESIKMCVHRWPSAFCHRPIHEDYCLVHGALFGGGESEFRYIYQSASYIAEACNGTGRTALLMSAMQSVVSNVPCVIDRRTIKVVNDFNGVYTRLVAYSH